MSGENKDGFDQDIKSTLTTTAGITRKNFPETPGTINRGPNAAIVVMMAKVRVATSRAPPRPHTIPCPF